MVKEAGNQKLGINYSDQEKLKFPSQFQLGPSYHFPTPKEIECQRRVGRRVTTRTNKNHVDTNRTRINPD